MQLFKCQDCEHEFLSKYAHKTHICGKVSSQYIDRIEGLKAQQSNIARLMGVDAKGKPNIPV